MFKKRKNHSMRRKKKLKQVVSDLRRRGGAYITKSGIRRKCRSLLGFRRRRKRTERSR